MPGPIGPRGPQGLQGPPGAPGPSAGAGLSAYGGLYHSAVQLVSFPAVNTYVRLALNTALPSSFVTVGANTITVQQAGDYEINYNVLLNANAAIEVAAAVRNGGVVIPQTRGVQTLSVDSTTSLSYDARLSASTIVSLEAGATLDLALSVVNNLPAGLNAIVGNNANATLTVKKLNQTV